VLPPWCFGLRATAAGWSALRRLRLLWKRGKSSAHVCYWPRMIHSKCSMACAEAAA
jgi:hypothetical protein